LAFVLAKKRWLLLLLSAFVLTVGAARGAASLSSERVLVQTGKPTRVHRHHHRHVDPRLIRRLRDATWRWQATMGTRRSARALAPYTPRTLRAWHRIARRAYRAYVSPPHKSGWLCIHRYEGSWSDSGDPYWGGLQMDRGFMEGYAPHNLLRRGWADRWSPLEQMWVAERAYRAGRGFYAWPNTARVCGLI
jgi:hypothetical protein